MENQPHHGLQKKVERDDSAPLPRPHVQYCVQMWCPQHKNNTNCWRGQSATKMMSDDALLLQGEVQQSGIFLPGEEKSTGRMYFEMA